MTLHQNLYEINTRVWLYNLTEKFGEIITLMKVPEEYWVEIISKGFDWVWLMGVWEHSVLSLEELQSHPGLIEEINQALPGWKMTDVIGSPYSIVKYDLNPLLGGQKDLVGIKEKLNQMGVKLMLDFVPNHFGKDTPLAISHPDYFISLKSPPSDQSLFNKVGSKKGTLWVAYGKDPYFSPWDDTFQLNYFNHDTRGFMTDTLSRIASQCDGVRCDMAMLCLNDIFGKTWGQYLSQIGFKQLQTEFWEEAITTIKREFPDFVFLAEVYWDLGWRLQQLGFDYTYDKRLFDRLETGSPQSVLGHLHADLEYQRRSLRFIENHDEKRAVLLGKEKSMAAAVICGTIPGLSLYHQGQLEGYHTKIPVQLRRKKQEQVDNEIETFYNKLLGFTNQEVFQQGSWFRLRISKAWEGNNSWENLLAWQWRAKKQEQSNLVVVNYSAVRSQGRVFPVLNKIANCVNYLVFEDILNGETYERNRIETSQYGLYVDLEPYQCHLFNL